MVLSLNTDSQARVGFFGWDEDLTRLDSGTGGYAFLYNATNSSETFTGTDAYIKAVLSNYKHWIYINYHRYSYWWFGSF